MMLDEMPLLQEAQIQGRVAELGNTISASYTVPILMLVVLKGALPFGADLLRHLPPDTTVDFVRARSYAGTRSTGRVQFSLLPETDLRGRDVLLVEDILDTGVTASSIVAQVLKHEPASLRVCALLDKPSRRVVEIEGDYIGFTIPDLFVVGYGLDYEEAYRGLRSIHVLHLPVQRGRNMS